MRMALSQYKGSINMGSISEDKKDVISQMEYELVEKQDENGNMIVVKVF